MTTISMTSLQSLVGNSEDDSYFFSRNSMKYFGDRISNFGVRDGGRVLVEYDDAGNYFKGGFLIDAWELYRRKPVKSGLKDSSYFNKLTGNRLFPVNSGGIA